MINCAINPSLKACLSLEGYKAIKYIPESTNLSLGLGFTNLVPRARIYQSCP